MKKALKHFAVFVLDRGANVLFRGDGGETISKRLGRVAAEGPVPFPVKTDRYIQSCIYRMLEWLDPGHCSRVVK